MKSRYIVETAVSLPSSASMPQVLRDEESTTTTDLIIRMTSPISNNKSPYEFLLKTPPDYSLRKTLLFLKKEEVFLRKTLLDDCVILPISQLWT